MGLYSGGLIIEGISVCDLGGLFFYLLLLLFFFFFWGGGGGGGAVGGLIIEILRYKEYETNSHTAFT